MGLIDILFPPLCKACQEPSSTDLLCPSCWQLSQLPDPVTRCRHCFSELDSDNPLCGPCRRSPRSPAIQGHLFPAASPASLLSLEAHPAWAAFALIQLERLDWPTPDTLTSTPDTPSRLIALELAASLQRPYARTLSPSLHYLENRLEENHNILILSALKDASRVLSAVEALFAANPHRIYLLTLSELI